MLKRIMALAAVAGVLLYAGATRGVAADQRSPVSDQQFVWQASAAGLAEVNLSTLAKDRAHSEDVKKFAREMIDDHTKAADKLNHIADRERMRVAPSMDAEHQQLEARLANLSGKDFDRAYADAMLKDHEQAVSLFEREAKDGQNKELKEFADKTLPTLKDHLSMARHLTGHEEKSTAESGHEGHERTGARTDESGRSRTSEEKGRTENTNKDKSNKDNPDNSGKNKNGTSSSDKDRDRSDRK